MMTTKSKGTRRRDDDYDDDGCDDEKYTSLTIMTWTQVRRAYANIVRLIRYSPRSFDIIVHLHTYI